MRYWMALLAAASICVLIGSAASSDVGGCGVTGVCPPTGTEMGQSDYQRTPHPNVCVEPTIPNCVTTTPPTPVESLQQPIAPLEEPVPAPAGTGLGPLTPPLQSNIAVDDNYIYVLQGHEVVKIDKKTLAVVGRTKAMQSPPTR